MTRRQQRNRATTDCDTRRVSLDQIPLDVAGIIVRFLPIDAVGALARANKRALAMAQMARFDFDQCCRTPPSPVEIKAFIADRLVAPYVDTAVDALIKGAATVSNTPRLTAWYAPGAIVAGDASTRVQSMFQFHVDVTGIRWAPDGDSSGGDDKNDGSSSGDDRLYGVGDAMQLQAVIYDTAYGGVADHFVTLYDDFDAVTVQASTSAELVRLLMRRVRAVLHRAADAIRLASDDVSARSLLDARRGVPRPIINALSKRLTNRRLRAHTLLFMPDVYEYVARRRGALKPCADVIGNGDALRRCATEFGLELICVLRSSTVVNGDQCAVDDLADLQDMTIYSLCKLMR